jgi:ribosome-associated protein
MTRLASAGMSLVIMGSVRDVSIRDDTIRLGQALKLAGLAGSGGEARALIEGGAVRVNGEVETRRGRQLRRGDVVTLGGAALRIA